MGGTRTTTRRACATVERDSAFTFCDVRHRLPASRPNEHAEERVGDLDRILT